VRPEGEARAVMARLDPRLSGSFWRTWRMTLILLRSRRFATVWSRKRINAMRHKNNVYHGILQDDGHAGGQLVAQPRGAIPCVVPLWLFRGFLLPWGEGQDEGLCRKIKASLRNK
jgi:hypothetical protein